MYLNHILDQSQGQNTQNQIQIQQIRHITSTASSSYGSQLSNMAESNSNNCLPFNSDPELSELLEEVMDIMTVTSGKIFFFFSHIGKK